MPSLSENTLSVAQFTARFFYQRARFSGLWDSILKQLVKLICADGGYRGSFVYEAYK